MSGSLATAGGESDQLQTGGDQSVIEMNNQAIQLVVQQTDVNRLVRPQEIPSDAPALERREVDEARTALPETLTRDALEGNQQAFNQHCESARVTGDLIVAFTTLRREALSHRAQIRADRANELYRNNRDEEARVQIAEMGRDNYDSYALAEGQDTAEQERDRRAEELLLDVGKGLNDDERSDAARAAAASGYFSPEIIQRVMSQWNLGQQEEDQTTTTIQFPVDENGAYTNPVMLSIQEGMRRQLDEIRDMQERGDTPDEIKQSAEYQRLARLARSTSRADSAISRIGGGEGTKAVATAYTPEVYARMQFEAGDYSVVPVRRQIG